MIQSRADAPHFDLWTEPWITLERPGGGRERLGIEQTLLRAHEFRAIYEPSPLAVVGTHRLLTAILQAAVDPQKAADLRRLWAAGRFSEDRVRAFGLHFGVRFDLFSSDAPFLQSADLALQPAKGELVKTAAYLFLETPSGSSITHYRHGSEETQVFCPVCAAAGLVTMPAFATSGGAGIKPSINGVPPIYVVPGGRTLFESLAASLLLPKNLPEVASHDVDKAWWSREPLVGHGQEVLEVGYLHSLTFPARRVRLHPGELGAPCTRCGQVSHWGVRTMVFDMGESRPKDAPIWFDPFAAYILPDDTSGKGPRPVRPIAGHALWREFGALFLPHSGGGGKAANTRRPGVLYQLANEDLGIPWEDYPFRCVGVRTDMKAKVFEWVDAGFEVPCRLLSNERAGDTVQEATSFATDCMAVLRGAFRAASTETRKGERHHGLAQRMIDDYWTALAGPFRGFVAGLSLLSPEQFETQARLWAQSVVREAQRAFVRAISALGDDAENLRRQVQGERICRYRLRVLTQKRYPLHEEEVND